ncbi:hypothetical protein [Bacillus sp. SA1-12]|uniref:hypothetical protein n=1 Tax=Bacillus sp. SA1-12 TaxID=1455638 RepID=UPI000A86011D|nr:hypothetical protein [Bacillus sp. SA1-12]
MNRNISQVILWFLIGSTILSTIFSFVVIYRLENGIRMVSAIERRLLEAKRNY